MELSGQAYHVTYSFTFSRPAELTPGGAIEPQSVELVKIEWIDPFGVYHVDPPDADDLLRKKMGMWRNVLFVFCCFDQLWLYYVGYLFAKMVISFREPLESLMWLGAFIAGTALYFSMRIEKRRQGWG